MDISLIVRSWMHKHAPKLLSFYEQFTLLEWIVIIFSVLYMTNMIL